MPRLTDRVVLITGASAGIGRATAVQVAAEGAAVVLCARRTGALDEAVAGIVSRGGKAVAIKADVASEAEMRALVDETVRRFGRLDVVIANAGMGYHHTFAETPTDVMRRLVDVNVMGTFYVARAAMDVFRRQNQGHIIAVSSIVGRRGIGGSAIYAATKAAQLGFIESLRAEFDGTPLRASVVFPVATATEFHAAIQRNFGLDTKGNGPQQSADDVARAIVKCVIRPTPEVYPYRMAKLLAIFSVIAPGIADGFVQRFKRQADVRPAVTD